MENRTENRSQLDGVLAWERALARHQRQQGRQQQWQQLLQQVKPLQAFLAQLWLRKNRGFLKTLVSHRQRTLTTR